jgi:hypothetical protein
MQTLPYSFLKNVFVSDITNSFSVEKETNPLIAQVKNNKYIHQARQAFFPIILGP